MEGWWYTPQQRSGSYHGVIVSTGCASRASFLVLSWELSIDSCIWCSPIVHAPILIIRLNCASILQNVFKRQPPPSQRSFASFLSSSPVLTPLPLNSPSFWSILAPFYHIRHIISESSIIFSIGRRLLRVFLKSQKRAYLVLFLQPLSILEYSASLTILIWKWTSIYITTVKRNMNFLTRWCCLGRGMCGGLPRSSRTWNMRFWKLVVWVRSCTFQVCGKFRFLGLRLKIYVRRTRVGALFSSIFRSDNRSWGGRAGLELSWWRYVSLLGFWCDTLCFCRG